MQVTPALPGRAGVDPDQGAAQTATDITVEWRAALLGRFAQQEEARLASRMCTMGDAARRGCVTQPLAYPPLSDIVRACHDAPRIAAAWRER
jgi:hypothetical protein